MTAQTDGFSVVLASSPEYEEITAEIFFDGKFVALINCEHGPEQLEIEIPSADVDQDKIARRVQLRGFLDSVKLASEKLRTGLDHGPA